METGTWNGRVLAAASLFAAFASAHLIDEFQWGAPAEFHLSVPVAQFLAFVFMAALAGLIAFAARGSHTGYFGLALTGFVIALADSLRHGPEILAPGPWRSGTTSEFLALGLTLSGIATACMSMAARRRP